MNAVFYLNLSKNIFQVIQLIDKIAKYVKVLDLLGVEQRFRSDTLMLFPFMLASKLFLVWAVFEFKFKQQVMYHLPTIHKLFEWRMYRADILAKEPVLTLIKIEESLPEFQ